ncbi:chemotaxis protein MotB [Collibacillus ludicampi]|uniref:Chemotaxis protein MotB n=1 Tax=Collibacillus ludicampi TaxID=2771369 RepID=A0AAV4LCA9_9BACL|nr:OmpA family protein [Collibacillus ludicampi]GIM45356.1 chemotaxis protein MotB [Collibacillus ludicampi]
MSRRRRREEKHANHERWLITYSDLITLLMIFFVVMYASSQIDVAKFKSLSVSLSQALMSKSMIDLNGGAVGGLDTGAPRQDRGDTPQNVVTDEEMQKKAERLKQLDAEEKKLEDLKKKLQEYVEKNGLQNKVFLNQTDESVQITFRDVALFDTGEANLKAEAKKTLSDIAPFFKGITNKITIEGHTDNRPIHTEQFPSNWELSSARALTVLHYLEDQGIQPNRMSATAYGEFQPVAPNDTEENQSKNRRVNIVVHRLPIENNASAK